LCLIRLQIFEASNGKEVGAGLVVPPNSQKILFPLGFKPENARGVPTLGVSVSVLFMLTESNILVRSGKSGVQTPRASQSTPLWNL
jgi:hypothetical protein